MLCGESGCGKSTILRLINGLIPNYYEGQLEREVLLEHISVKSIPLDELIESSSFQNPRFQFFNVDATSELAFGCENMGMPTEEIEARVSRTVRDWQNNSIHNMTTCVMLYTFLRNYVFVVNHEKTCYDRAGYSGKDQRKI